MKILTDILSILTHPVRFFKEKTVFLLSSVIGESENTLRCSSARVKKSKFRFQGKINKVCLNGCELFNCSFFLRGNGHSLIVDEGVKLNNLHIKIIGCKNTVHIGANTSCGGGNIICGGNGNSITVGKDCVLAESIDIWATDTHSITQDGQVVNIPKSIHIGDHVWAGKDVAILKGVSVGDGAVIGMRSLVTHDIAARTLNVGNPARQIKENIDWAIRNPNN